VPVLNDSDMLARRGGTYTPRMTRCPPTARLITPRRSLAACVRAYVTRDTVGANLTPLQRFNHVPASPACAVTWFVQGSAQWVQGGMPAGPVVVCGPKSLPATSCNPGPVRVFTMLVMPDALRMLTGFDAGAQVNRSMAADAVFDSDWMAMLHAVLAAANDETRVRLIEDFMEPRWQAARGETWPGARSFHDWTQSLAMRAAVSHIGRSLRQADRRIRSWAGMPLRTLHGLARVERSFLEAQSAHAQGRLNWAEVALDAGYADQSHMCRESKRVTGSSPQRLLRRVEEDEAFWIYRLWR
jgi:AraC-like DNA-binding protein